MTIKQQGGIFGRNPTFSSADIEGPLTANTLAISGATTVNTLATSGATTIGGALSAVTARFPAGTYPAIGDAADLVLGSTSGSNGLTIVSSTSGSGLINFGDNTNTDAGQIIYNHGTAKLSFLVERQFIAEFNSNGLAFPSGKGIDFSATAGTGTSELFDDYEEGTWTPQDSVNAALTTTRATYVKIGQLVVLSFNFTYSATASSLVKNLPFTASNDGYGSGFVSYSTSGIAQGILVNANTSTFDFTDLKSSFPSVANAQLMGTVIYTA